MTRRCVILDGTWEFFADPHQHLQPDSLESDAPARLIQVPGPWQAQFDDLRDYTGVAWYRLAFEAPDFTPQQLPLDPTYILHFGAVDYHTSVWLNGKHLGEHEGGYLPFELTLDDALNLGVSNQLVVRVIDPGDDAEEFPDLMFTEIPHGKQSWYGPISGIWQSVYLEVRHRTFIQRLHVTPDVTHEQAQVDLKLN